MGLEIASIASGSNGNCYYIGNQSDAILVDAGISCRELEKRMSRLELSLEKVKAILISHEHSDHIRGLATLANKYQIPVFIHGKTKSVCKLAIPDRLLQELHPESQIYVGTMKVSAFFKYHDAIAPLSFVIEEEGVKVGVFTDIGRVCESVIHHFSQCHAAFLETNYDPQMLLSGRYPYFLKNRIRGGLGHLSNEEALELFERHRSPHLRLLFLSHLSRDNNDPVMVQTMFRALAGDVEIVLASRESETPLFGMTASDIFCNLQESTLLNDNF